MSDTEHGFDPTDEELADLRTSAEGPAGELPLTPQMLLEEPSGNLFGLTQNVGMGWRASDAVYPPYLILSTMGGMRTADGRPVALGYHTGHWELNELVKEAALELARHKAIPFAGYVSDPCDGRTQGTVGMFDSLAYRNDAAIVLRRLIRSLPTRRGVLGIATCDKGLPAMMMALAGAGDLPGIIVPGGVTLPPARGEDAGKVQTLGTRFAHGQISLREAAELGCRACATPGGGCQFLGTAATAQVVAEAMGLALPHSALVPSGQAVWRRVARRSAATLVERSKSKLTTQKVLTDASIRNAMVVHAAFGGSTNLLLHIPAVAHAAKLWRPSVEDWRRINATTPRLVSVLPNGPVDHPTVRVFLAGGVPEVMLHLRELGLLDCEALAATGEPLDVVLDCWQRSEGRRRFRDALFQQDNVDPDDVISPPAEARRRGMTSTLSFLTGNLAPDGAIVKSTAIDPALFTDGRFEHEGPAVVFASEAEAINAIKSDQLRAGDVVILAGVGPSGTGMEETYQVTSALKQLPIGKQVVLVTDARFSGVSTGACIGHVGPEALAGGPLGRVIDGDRIRVTIDTNTCDGRVDFVGTRDAALDAVSGAAMLSGRLPRVELAAHAQLPDDTRLWAALQAASGGTWAGCVYDVDEIIAKLARSG